MTSRHNRSPLGWDVTLGILLLVCGLLLAFRQRVPFGSASLAPHVIHPIQRPAPNPPPDSD